MTTNTHDIGLIGLAVMGQNLVLNMNDHGYKVAVLIAPPQKWMISWMAAPKGQIFLEPRP